MKAVIEVDVPDYQIGQEVNIYFKDTMQIKGTVKEEEQQIHCEDCEFFNENDYTCFLLPRKMRRTKDWFCANALQRGYWKDRIQKIIKENKQ